MSPQERTDAKMTSIDLCVGLEVHVELATRTKMFSRSLSPAHAETNAGGPNELTDPTVLGLPGALPVMNKHAVEMSMKVGLALGCSIAEFTKWDRKSYFYPDLPKGYQISQYDMPLCFDGAMDVPGMDKHGFVDFKLPSHRVRILRAHLEEDAGKLMHEAPGGEPIDFSIVDLSRAGTPLLEIVTEPDFTDPDQVVCFCRMLRDIVRFLGVSEAIMQEGQMRFEPNINTIITLADGRVVKTPIVEIKNLNSFRFVKGAIEYELREQPTRWREDGRELGPGTKQTRGWDDARGQTVLQREKEEAQDYRYFPDPDLIPVIVDEAWRNEVAAAVPELPLSRLRRYVDEYGLSERDATPLIESSEDCLFYEACIGKMAGVERAGRVAANIVLQVGLRLAKERDCAVSGLGVSPDQVAAIGRLRASNEVSSSSAEELFELLTGADHAGTMPQELAKSRGMLIVRDAGALKAWCEQAIAGNEQAAADVRSGNMAAMGRLIGAVMKLSGGQADAKEARQCLMEELGGS